MIYLLTVFTDVICDVSECW